MASPQPEELFPASLIPAAAAGALSDEGFRFRPLRREDFGQGFLDCLRVLTWVGDYTEADFLERYDDMARSNGTYFYLVLEHGGRVVGTGALVVEKKLYVSSQPHALPRMPRHPLHKAAPCGRLAVLFPPVNM